MTALTERRSFYPIENAFDGDPEVGGRRLASHYARVYLSNHLAREVAERAAAFKRRLHRL